MIYSERVKYKSSGVGTSLSAPTHNYAAKAMVSRSFLARAILSIVGEKYNPRQ